MPRTSFLVVEVPVRGETGDYIVRVQSDIPITCTCPDFINRKGPNGQQCKHMAARGPRNAPGVTRCWRCLAWLLPEVMDFCDPENDHRLCPECSHE